MTLEAFNARMSTSKVVKVVKVATQGFWFRLLSRRKPSGPRWFSKIFTICYM